MSDLLFFSTQVLILVVILQELALNYSRTDALHTRKVIRDALIDVIKKGQRIGTEWNVEVIMQSAEQLHRRQRPTPKRHRTMRIKGPRQKFTDIT